MARKTRSKAGAAKQYEHESDEERQDDDLTISDPPTIDPYKVLEVPSTATSDEIKKAYRKLALQKHPDKAKPEDRKAAHDDFQKIAFAYAVLSDERRRKRYDTTGNVAESANLDDDDFNWVDFFKEQTSDAVRGEMIEQVKREYQGSEEERADILAAYERGRGNMDAVYESVLCSDVLEDDERFRKIIETAIADGEVKSYKDYVNERPQSRKRRKAAARSEAAEAEAYARELGVEEKLFGNRDKTKKKAGKDSDSGNDAGLRALIRQRQESRAQNFFADLEAKYGGGGTSGKHKLDEPPEEAFQKNAKKGRKAKP